MLMVVLMVVGGDSVRHSGALKQGHGLLDLDGGCVVVVGLSHVRFVKPPFFEQVSVNVSKIEFTGNTVSHEAFLVFDQPQREDARG